MMNFAKGVKTVISAPWGLSCLARTDTKERKLKEQHQKGKVGKIKKLFVCGDNFFSCTYVGDKFFGALWALLWFSVLWMSFLSLKYDSLSFSPFVALWFPSVLSDLRGYDN